MVQARPRVKNTYPTSYSRLGAATTAEMGAVVIDPAPILEGEPGGPMVLFGDTGVHYSARGAAKLAAFVYAKLFGGV